MQSRRIKWIVWSFHMPNLSSLYWHNPKEWRQIDLHTGLWFVLSCSFIILLFLSLTNIQSQFKFGKNSYFQPVQLRIFCKDVLKYTSLYNSTAQVWKDTKPYGKVSSSNCIAMGIRTHYPCGVSSTCQSCLLMTLCKVSKSRVHRFTNVKIRLRAIHKSLDNWQIGGRNG